jgi:hypothetical protein
VWRRDILEEVWEVFEEYYGESLLITKLHNLHRLEERHDTFFAFQKAGHTLTVTGVIQV